MKIKYVNWLGREGNLNEKRRFLLMVFFALTLFGLLMVYEASSIYAWKKFGDSGYFFKRQALFFILGVIVLYFTLFLNLDILRRYSREFLLFNIFLLLLVVLVGREAGGAKRWLPILGFSFQPSELLKVSYLLYCADYFYRKGRLVRNFVHGVLPLMIVYGIIFLLVFFQRDLGTVFFWLIWIFLFLFILKARKRDLLFLSIVGIFLFILLIHLFPSRINRIIAYLNPWLDPQQGGYQLVQSQIAFGEGGIFGVGLGRGKQKLLFLPAAHTDFIFSIIAEEFGFLGAGFLLILLFLIFTKMLFISSLVKPGFRRNICIGISLIFGLEVLINTGVSCGFFPTKGLPLPFISYGGSNLVTHYFLLGLFFNASKNSNLVSPEGEKR